MEAFILLFQMMKRKRRQLLLARLCKYQTSIIKSEKNIQAHFSKNYSICFVKDFLIFFMYDKRKYLIKM